MVDDNGSQSTGGWTLTTNQIVFFQARQIVGTVTPFRYTQRFVALHVTRRLIPRKRGATPMKQSVNASTAGLELLRRSESNSHPSENACVRSVHLALHL